MLDHVSGGGAWGRRNKIRDLVDWASGVGNRVDIICLTSVEAYELALSTNNAN